MRALEVQNPSPQPRPSESELSPEQDPQQVHVQLGFEKHCPDHRECHPPSNLLSAHKVTMPAHGPSVFFFFLFISLISAFGGPANVVFFLASSPMRLKTFL